VTDRPLTRRQALARLGAASALALPGAPGRAAGTAPLTLALAPFLSPAALFAAFEPLRAHLQQRLARPVELVSSRDFRSHVLSTQRGEHDLVQLPAHLGRLAMLDWGWRMLATADEVSQVIVAVRDGGPVTTPAALRGRTVAMLDPLSLTATVGRRWLQQQGLAEGVTVQALPSINSMLFALDRGEVDAFVAADTQLRTLPPATPRGERVLARIEGIPAPLLLARPGLPGPELQALVDALTRFEPDPSRPASVANSRLVPLPAARLAALDVYAQIARRALASPARP
jgi:phosphonate transport system substrate-binding protein